MAALILGPIVSVASLTYRTLVVVKDAVALLVRLNGGRVTWQLGLHFPGRFSFLRFNSDGVTSAKVLLVWAPTNRDLFDRHIWILLHSLAIGRIIDGVTATIDRRVGRNGALGSICLDCVRRKGAQGVVLIECRTCILCVLACRRLWVHLDGVVGGATRRVMRLHFDR